MEILLAILIVFLPTYLIIKYHGHVPKLDHTAFAEQASKVFFRRHLENLSDKLRDIRRDLQHEKDMGRASPNELVLLKAVEEQITILRLEMYKRDLRLTNLGGEDEK